MLEILWINIQVFQHFVQQPFADDFVAALDGCQPITYQQSSVAAFSPPWIVAKSKSLSV
jgi:hypothetical protein